MVTKRQCSFCADEIEPGTGTMYVKRDGTVYHFCSASCRKQQLKLHRVGQRFKWTRAYALQKAAAARHSAAPKATPSVATRPRAAAAGPASVPPASESAPAQPPAPKAPAEPAGEASRAPPETAPAPKPTRPAQKKPAAKSSAKP